MLRISENDTRTAYVLKCDVRKFFASIDHDVLLSLIERHIADERTIILVKNIINSFRTAEGKGIPLGNLTSQLFANVYLNEFDRYVKMHLREKYYLRYCDDFVILGLNRRELEELIVKIDAFLKRRLFLALHPNKVSICSWSQGIDFLGYVSLPHCTLVRTKTVHRILDRVFRKNLRSYTGVCSHADAFELKQVVYTKVFGSGN